ncbi:hypothetical protein CR513_45934, partial [Mucuna pruriens]
MKHPTEDHSLFGIDIIDELVAEHLQLEVSSTKFQNFAEDIDAIDCLGSAIDESDYDNLCEVQDLFDSKDDIDNLVDLVVNSEIVDLIDQACKYDEEPEYSKGARVQVVETKKPLQAQLKSSPSHLKYAYLDDDQQFPIIIANDLHREQEEKLLQVLRQHKQAIGWRLSNLPGINPLIYMRGSPSNKATTMKIESDHPRCGSEGSNKTVCYQNHLPHFGYLVQVVPKKSKMIIMKNQHDELATRKDNFPLPFIDQVLEKLAGKSHYCFVDGFSGYMQIHIAPEDQHRPIFTCPFGTFAYTHMSFGLCNVSSTFQCCMTSIFSYLL